VAGSLKGVGLTHAQVHKPPICRPPPPTRTEANRRSPGETKRQVRQNLRGAGKASPQVPQVAPLPLVRKRSRRSAERLRCQQDDHHR
jgi:hypothetical protein